MEADLVVIFCRIDDFCKYYNEQALIGNKPLLGTSNNRNSECKMTHSEIMTVFIYGAMYSTDFKTFKAFYNHKQAELKSAFPNLLSYERLIELKQEVNLYLAAFLLSILGQCTGISYVDSTKIEACKVKRTSRHKTLKGIAKTGKTSDGWFFGTKLHLLLNDKGEIINFMLTPGNVADNNHRVVEFLSHDLFGKFFGDKGYILDPDFWRMLFERGIQFIHGMRKNMKARPLMPLLDTLLLRKRASMVETVIGILKDRMSLQYTRVRSVYGFLCNFLCSLIAYQLRPNKPKIPCVEKVALTTGF
jgi:Transposase DDE domain